MKTVCIVQARLGSTRFPRKVLAELCGKPMLWHVLTRVKRAALLDEVVCAVPAQDLPDLGPVITDAGCVWYADNGDEADLVGRYLAAATWHQAELVVRVCADNPCVQPDYIDDAITEYMAWPYLFYSNTTTAVPGCHQPDGAVMCVDGLGAEVFTMSRLQWLEYFTANPPPYLLEKKAECREHPHQLFELYDNDEGPDHIYIDPNLFQFQSWHTLRLDVNTPDDYAFIQDLYEHVYPTHPQFTIQDILAYLATKEVSHAR